LIPTPCEVSCLVEEALDVAQYIVIALIAVALMRPYHVTESADDAQLADLPDPCLLATVTCPKEKP